MKNRVTRTCEVCGEIVLRGTQLYKRGDEDDGIDGEYESGAGECERCGRVLCADCADFDEDGLCVRCQEEATEDGEYDEEEENL
jgi:hypothetical protein